MTATVTSSRPLPSTLTVPTTQNTAPIVEFRCLYTHDLRRKQKRWQDGFLRFHTFNRRVMVYDVPRNYVGDTHWRDSNVVQDGDEFELDRGVLIQVGEETGSVEQDISGIIEKRQKAPDIPIATDLLSKPPNKTAVDLTCSVPSQVLRPKPLNAVLGTPKGSLGRALPPTKSPYDQRRTAHLVGSDERSAKRQRVQTAPERRLTLPPKAIQRPHDRAALAGGNAFNEAFSSSLTRLERINKDKSKPATTRKMNDSRPWSHDLVKSADTNKPVSAYGRCAATSSPHPNRNAEAIIVDSSQEDAAALKRNKTARELKEGLPMVEHSTANEILRDEGYADVSAEQVRRPTTATSEESSQSASTFKARWSNRSATSTSVDQEITGSETLKARAKLKMGKSQPRRKLMYRQLLPPGLGDAVHERFPENNDSMANDGVIKPSKKVDAAPRSLSSLHRAEQDRFNDRLTRSTAKEAAPNTNIQHSNRTRPANESSAENQRWRHIDPPSTEARARAVPKASPRVQDTNDVLSKVDKILIAKSQKPAISSRPDRPLKTFFEGATPAAADHPTPESTLAGWEPRPPDQDHTKTQVQSSPGVEPPPTHASPSRPTSKRSENARPPDRNIESSRPRTEAPVTTEAIELSLQPVSNTLLAPDPAPSRPSEPVTSLDPRPHAPTLLAPDHQPANPVRPLEIPTPISAALPKGAESLPQSSLPTNTSNAPEDAPLPRNKTLPTFKAPSRRSPLKKTVSDTSSTRPLPDASGLQPVAVSKDSGIVEAAAQAAEPWSKEAWDLFGCGRDGKKCSYAEFIEREGEG